MSRARQIIVVLFGLAVALCFLRIPWTDDVGYSWLWSRPKPVAVNDIVAEARRRWRTEYEANTSERIARSLAQEIVNAPHNPYHTETKEELSAAQLRAKNVGERAKWRRDAMSKRQSMSDEEVASWLKDTGNFDDTFPDKTGLDAQAKANLLDEWEKNVRPMNARNTRIGTARIDFARIGMEVAVLSALLLAGLALTSKRAA